MENEKAKSALEIVKAVLIAIILNLAFVLLFAAVLKVANLSDTAVRIINQIAKVAVILISCLVSVKGKGALWKCGLIGFVVTVLSYFLFSLLSHGAVSVLSLVTEAGFGLVAGLVTGAITALLGRQPN